VARGDAMKICCLAQKNNSQFYPLRTITVETCRPDPTLFLAHCKAHKAAHKKPALQRAKNASAQPHRLTKFSLSSSSYIRRINFHRQLQAEYPALR